MTQRLDVKRVVITQVLLELMVNGIQVFDRQQLPTSVD